MPINIWKIFQYPLLFHPPPPRLLVTKEYTFHIIAEISGHVDIDDDEEQPTDCISKPAFKDVMNTITVLEDYSLFSNFRADLMKALKDVNRTFDLDCLSHKKQSTITAFFQTLYERQGKKKKKNSLFLNSTVSLIRTLIPPSLGIRIREAFYNSNLSPIRT